MSVHKELELEREICETLQAQGWVYSPTDAGYDRGLAVFPADVIGWLEDTQPDRLARVVKPGSPTKSTDERKLIERVVTELQRDLRAGGGVLGVLRGGFKMGASGTLDMMQSKPETTDNPTTQARYDANRLRVMRQVHYADDQRSIDLVFFINGIPVATAELKTENTQSVEIAKHQYRQDRLPKEKGREHRLLDYRSGALVHFAVSEDEVWMTTKLAGTATHFLPFNRGNEDDGAGNPANPDGWKTAYLWDRVLQRDAWIGILARFMFVDVKTRTDQVTGRQSKEATLIFPRFHQWEAVTEIEKAVTVDGAGEKYLVQHSAGSGKTNTIAWTAHRMARLQVDNRKAFDTVIVVTDRNVLDVQLQEAIRQLDKKDIVVTVDEKTTREAGKSKSGVLASALETGKLIVVVTIQTFPFVLNELSASSALRGRKFAVIADEAHSSQSGQVSTELRKVLSAQEIAEAEDGGGIDVEATLLAEMSARAAAENISFFAFTATPKAKTLELFGQVPAGGDKPEPFHLYSMKQAIEEGFIIDVLRGYRSYRMSFEIGAHDRRAAETEVEKTEASKRVMQWVKLNPKTIGDKAAIMVEHFNTQVKRLLEGTAKAMVVTDSRVAAIKYKRAMDEYIASRKLSLRTLVAFSGTVEDEDELGPGEFTEARLNPGAGDLRRAFMLDDNKVMIVANKFQTGFDQPLLCAMYVDKQLSGITAVQTLSRLNRTHRTRNGVVKDASMTHVVDFVNDPAEIQEAFQVYYRDAHVETRTDENLVHDVLATLDSAAIYTQDEVDTLVRVVMTEGTGDGSKVNSKIAAGLAPAKERFRRRLEEAELREDKIALDELSKFRKDVGSFTNLYDFMSQIFDYSDADIEKKARYLRLLAPHLREHRVREEIDLSGIELTRLQITDRGQTDISLADDRVALRGTTSVGSGTPKDPQHVALLEVIQFLNEHIGLAASASEGWVRSMTATAEGNEQLVAQARANSLTQFEDSPDLDELILDVASENQEAHSKVVDFLYSDDPSKRSFKRALVRLMWEELRDEAA